MVLDNRLIGIRSNWEPTIQIIKIAIRFSTNTNNSGLSRYTTDSFFLYAIFIMIS